MKEDIYFSDFEPKPLPTFFAKTIPEINVMFSHTGVLASWNHFSKKSGLDLIDYIIPCKPKTLFLWQFSAMARSYFDIPVSKKTFYKKHKYGLDKFFKHLPNSKIIFCCNNEESLNVVPTEYGDRLSAIVCNHNATVDRNMFTLTNKMIEHRKYDSIYVARICTQKRHYLAKHLNKIALVTGGQNTFGFDEMYKQVCSNLSDKEFLFLHKNIPSTEVLEMLNDSKVGLCLSANEGAMFASIEYLLCGLPIVSTKSKGGRDVFFTDKNCIIAEDTPESVSKCVQHWLDNYPTWKQRDEIRQEAIATQKKHTKVLKDKLKEISPSDIDIDAIYKKEYVHKMHCGTTLHYKGKFV